MTSQIHEPSLSMSFQIYIMVIHQSLDPLNTDLATFYRGKLEKTKTTNDDQVITTTITTVTMGIRYLSGRGGIDN